MKTLSVILSLSKNLFKSITYETLRQAQGDDCIAYEKTLNNKRKKSAHFPLFASSILYILCFTSLSNCGYSLQNSHTLPFESIKIGKIINRTSEPKLQDKLHVALTEEFLRHGVSVIYSSENVLTGEIIYFNLKTLSEKKEFAAEYEVIIRGDFRFKDNTGKIKGIKGVSSPFIESFHSAENISGIIASKEVAEKTALKRLSIMIVSELIH